ncbi:MAG TPA: hypothetical protein VLT34_07675, partial [Arthrobacter sp.]|nr:hypothetical protein [Arthrobacter sp.]
MESTVWSAESRESLAAVAASVAALAAIADAGAHSDESGGDQSGVDPFRDGAGPSREAGSDPWADPLRD